MDNKLINVKVIVGSVRQGRFANRAASWIAEEIRKKEGVKAEIIDLLNYEMPFFNEM